MANKSKAKEILEIYYNGEYPQRVRDLIQGWLVSDDSGEEKDAAMEQIFMETVNYKPNPSKRVYRLKVEWNRRNNIQAKQRQVLMPFYRTIALRVAAVVVPLLVIGGVVLLGLRQSQPTEPAQMVTVTLVVDSIDNRGLTALADNSNIIIRPGSSLSYADDFNTGSVRKVAISGEVYFSVAPDSIRQFVVETEHLNVNVLGTKFDVDARPDSEFTTITLYSGVVRVDSKTISNMPQITMEPGKQLVVNNATGEYRIEHITTQIPTWIATKLDFSRSSLDDIFKALEWYYGVEIETQGLFKNTSFSFKLSGKEDINSALALIKEITLGFTYTIDGDIVLVRGDNGNK